MIRSYINGESPPTTSRPAPKPEDNKPLPKPTRRLPKGDASLMTGTGLAITEEGCSL